MSELGQLLKKARLDNNMSLEKLEEITKIRKRYLEAIETGEYKVLPGSFYVRAFIKSYAEAVGLDPSEVLGLYSNVIPAPSVETTVEPIRRKKTHARNSDKISKWASTILMLAFVMLILGVLYYFISDSYQGDTNKQVDETDRITDKKQAESKSAASDGGTLNPNGGAKPTATPAPTPTPTPAVPVLALVRTENNTDYYSLTNADKLNINYSTKGEECWLRIDKLVPVADGKTERQGLETKLYKKGEVREWISDVSVYITVGLPAAAEITVNGQLLNFADLKNARNVVIELKKA